MSFSSVPSMLTTPPAPMSIIPWLAMVRYPPAAIVTAPPAPKLALPTDPRLNDPPLLMLVDIWPCLVTDLASITIELSL